jgi:hypothetical protein
MVTYAMKTIQSFISFPRKHDDLRRCFFRDFLHILFYEETTFTCFTAFNSKNMDEERTEKNYK